MSSTRRADPDSPRRQERWASSPELQRGLMANLVAKRCSVLQKPGSRALVWEIQYRSHQAGGLVQLAHELIEGYPKNVGHYRLHEPGLDRSAPLPREIIEEIWPDGTKVGYNQVRAARAMLGVGDGKFADELAKNPSKFTPSAFDSWCRDAAGRWLHESLQELCLNPETCIDYEEWESDPWFFDDLVKCLRKHFAARAASLKKSTVTTAIGRKVCEQLHYALEARCLTLTEGEARTGKTFAAQRWCEQNAGRARFVEVPPGNDDFGFYRAIARSLGVSVNLNSKANELRDRVEDVLLAGDLVLSLDEAQRAWPQTNLHRGWPARINWIMAMVNQGVPIAMIATPQFLKAQRIIEDKTGWNGSQLTGRLGLYERLPDRLGESDLLKVVSALLPEASAACLKHVVTYARISSRYLAAVEYVAKRARYLAHQDGREKVTTDDIRAAMATGVIPSDRALSGALQAAGARKRRTFRAPLASLPQFPCGMPAGAERDTRPNADFTESLPTPDGREVALEVPIQACAVGA